MSEPTQVKEGDSVAASTLGNLWFGKDGSDKARAIRVNEFGEIQIAELPGTQTIVTADANNRPFFFPFGTQVFSVPRGKREANGNSPDNFSILNAGQFTDFNLGSNSSEGSTDGDVGLCTMSSPKYHVRSFSEFNNNYHSANLNKAMSSGSHGSSNTSLAVFRFRRGTITFTDGIAGTPPGVIKIRLIGRPTGEIVGQVQLKEWVLSPENFNNFVSNNGALRFEVMMPYMHIAIVATPGADAGNNFQIANFKVNLFS